MRRGTFMAACLLAWPAAGAEPPAAKPDAEFLEFLGSTTEEEEEFIDYMESRKGERALQRAEKEAAKEDDDE